MGKPVTLTLTMNPAIDVTTEAPRLEAGRKTRCEAPVHEPGGGGINVARAMASLGGDVRAVFPAGGHTGDLLEELVADTGVAYRRVEIDLTTRESWSVAETDSGRHFHLVFPGLEMQSHHWQACQDAVLEGDATSYLVLSGSLPPGVPEGFYAAVAHAASQRGTRCVLDTSGAPLSRALEAGGFFLVRVNRHEMADALDLDPEAPADWVGPLRTLVHRGVAEAMVMTLGAKGALLVTADAAWRASPPEVQERSAVGAGDSFVAAVVMALTAGQDFEQALVRGVAAAAAAVTTRGTRLFDPDDVERLRSQVEVEPLENAQGGNTSTTKEPIQSNRTEEA